MAVKSKYMLSLRRRRGLLIVILAAALLELLSAAQYYYTHYLMEEQLEKRAESELTLKAILIKSRLNSAEDDLQNHIWDIRENLTHPDSVWQSIGRMIQLSRVLQGGAVSFVPDYYPAKGRWYEPYAQKSGDSIVKRQIGGPDHDYTSMKFYQQGIAAGDAVWIEPYVDGAGAQTSVISYAKPIYDKRQDLAGVVCVDVALNWLRDTIDRRHLYPSSFVLLLTEDGRPIIRPSENRISKEESDGIINLINDSTVARKKNSNGRITKIYFDTDKRDGTVFYANLKGEPHWQLAVVCYDDEVYGPLLELRIRLLLLSLLAFGVLSYMIYSFARNEKKLMNKTLEQERLRSELHIAREIQTQMLPRENSVTRDDVDICGSLAPAREVGGDLYGYVINEDQLYFCVGDVSGKGVPASLFMAQATRLFLTLAKQGLQPAEICTQMNDALAGEDNENGVFVTFFLGLLDLKSGHLSFCNAGHNPPVIGGTPSHGDFLKMESNAPFGLWAGLQYIGEEIESIKGRPLFIYTDGLNEAENRQLKQFGNERLLSILRNTHFESSQQVIETLAAEVKEHRNGAEPNDDLTMMCIRVE